MKTATRGIGSHLPESKDLSDFLMLSARDMWADTDMHVKVFGSLWDISRGSCKGIRIRARACKQAEAEKGAYDDPSPVWCLSRQE